jgi:hypothetical protein
MVTTFVKTGISLSLDLNLSLRDFLSV